VRNRPGSPEGAPLLPDQGDGTVVDQLDLHHGPEDAGLDMQPLPSQPGDEPLEQRTRLVRRHRPVEAGTFPPGQGARQGELRDRQDRPPYIAEAAVDPSPFVLEHPETGDLPDRPVHSPRIVLPLETDEEEQSRPDPGDRLSPDSNRRPTHALDHDPHGDLPGPHPPFPAR